MTWLLFCHYSCRFWPFSVVVPAVVIVSLLSVGCYCCLVEELRRRPSQGLLGNYCVLLWIEKPVTSTLPAAHFHWTDDDNQTDEPIVLLCSCGYSLSLPFLSCPIPLAFWAVLHVFFPVIIPPFITPKSFVLRANVTRQATLSDRFLRFCKFASAQKRFSNQPMFLNYSALETQFSPSAFGRAHGKEKNE